MPDAQCIASLVTPRDERGSIDFRAFYRNAAFALENGAQGLCVGAAEGEYLGMSSDERLEMFGRARKAAGGGRLVCGIGAPSAAQAARLGAEAFEVGADAVLLPPPSYYRYDQSDVRAFYDAVACKVEGPLILSNAPRHATPVEPGTAAWLCCEIANLTGVRDSSGSPAVLSRVGASGSGAALFVGRGDMLAEALQAGCCDGIISGIAAVLPELIAGLPAAYAAGDAARFGDLASAIEDVMEQVGKLPIPWGFKLIAECRGLGKASFAVPLSLSRREQTAAFKAWFRGWWNGSRGGGFFAREAAALR